jgi:hypothetical protein
MVLKIRTGIQGMQRQKLSFLLVTLALLLANSLAFGAGPDEAGKEATVIVTARTVAQLLPERLAGVKASGELQQFGRDNLATLVGEKAAAYQEYLVTEAASRQYGAARVEIFQTENAFAAFGLFTYAAGAQRTAATTQALGSSSAKLADALIFWEGNYFVRVASVAASPLQASLARSVSETLSQNKTAVKLPPLMESLPRQQAVAASEKYFLGPESLNDYVERGRDMFGFAGDAEAAMAEYHPNTDPSAPPADASSRPRLLIVEYHTPEFAADANRRINAYLASLAEDERNRIVVKRQGNYIVEALNFDDREFARSLIDSVEYPYTVQLLNPNAPMNDPFAAQKAARMMISTFSIIGLTILTVLFVGSTFGAMIFLKRRKQQQAIFSDAGGMLRLDLDPFETVILGLPPKRTNAE